MSSHYDGTAVEQAALNSYIKLSRATEVVTQRIHSHLSAWGLTVSQFGALEALYHLGPLTVGQLGGKILRSSGNMTLVVDNLVKRGLVTRQPRPEDRRAYEIHLTPAGRELIAEILPAHVSGVVGVMAALTADEQAQLAALCKKLGLSVI
jgi:MarR family transcriptional regulator, 2-MHQ and catechol-resistance regulon repressor